MAKELPHVVMPKYGRTELQTFASWFHQDWKLVFPDFLAGAKMYINSLSIERKSILKKELYDFIKKNKMLKPDKVKKAWLELGAQGWQADLDIVKTLHHFLSLL